MLSCIVPSACFFHRLLVTLADLASAHGFDRNEALALIHDPHELALTVAASDQARAQGVNSVPHPVIGDLALVGCRSEDQIAAAIAEVCIARC